MEKKAELFIPTNIINKESERVESKSDFYNRQ